MKNKIKIRFKIIIFIILILYTTINSNVYAVTNEQNIKNATVVYFSSKVTKTYGNGDCILIENYDSNGNKIYGLIDTGRKIATTDSEGKQSTVVKDFLQSHGVKELEFVIITHSHSDHNGDALTVLNEFSVKKIYMKECDKKYSSDATQSTYESIIKLAVEKNIDIIGISYLSTVSNEISPSATSSFISYMKENENKKELFKSFNENNTKFTFGSSNIQIFNWEIFDTDGNIYTTGVSTTTKQTVSNENANSLCILLTQGNKKAVFSGDMNNALYGNETVGDEDRIKSKIDKVDFLKLGHHGYKDSNTEGYLQTLNPKYAVITNDIDNAYSNTIKLLETNNIEYMYTAAGENEIIVGITKNNVYMGLELSDLYKINEEETENESGDEQKEDEIIDKEDENEAIEETKKDEESEETKKEEINNEQKQVAAVQVNYDSTVKANSGLPDTRKNNNDFCFRWYVVYFISSLY